jgi:hypothetical protein
MKVFVALTYMRVLFPLDSHYIALFRFYDIGHALTGIFLAHGDILIA